MNDICQQLINNPARESHSIIKTNYGAHALNITSPAIYQPVFVPNYIHSVSDISHSRLVRCEFCQIERYIVGTYSDGHIFCADCIVNNHNARVIDDNRRISILYHNGILNKMYIGANIAIFEIILDKNADYENEKDDKDEQEKVNVIIQIRNDIMELTNRCFKYIQTHSGNNTHSLTCQTCDTSRRDLYYILFPENPNKNYERYVVCVSCYRTIITIHKHILSMKFMTICEFPVVSDVLAIIRRDLIVASAFIDVFY